MDHELVAGGDVRPARARTGDGLPAPEALEIDSSACGGRHPAGYWKWAAAKGD